MSNLGTRGGSLSVECVYGKRKIVAYHTDVTTVAEGKYVPGDVLVLTDRALAVFDVVEGGTPNGYDIIDAGDGNTAVLNSQGMPINVKWVGAKGDGTTDDTGAIKAAIGDYSDKISVFFPAGTYRVTTKINLGLRKMLVGEGAELVEIEFDSSTDDYLFSGDAFCVVIGMTVTRLNSTIPQTAFASYTPTTANGWRNGAIKDVVINSFNYGIGSTQGLTQGLMFNNIYEKVRVYYADIPILMGAGSNNCIFSNCEFWYSNTRDYHLNNTTTMHFINCGFEGAIASNGLAEESYNIRHTNCYYEPAMGVTFDMSTGSFDSCHSTAFDSSTTDFLYAVNNSYVLINDFTDYNFGATSTGAMAFYTVDASSRVLGKNLITRAGTAKQTRSSTDGVIVSAYYSNDWHVVKYGNGVMTMDLDTKVSTSTLIMTGATTSFSVDRTFPENFVDTKYIAQGGIHANSTTAFLLIDDPVATAAANSTSQVSFAAKRAGSTFTDGYFYSIRCIGRWK